MANRLTWCISAVVVVALASAVRAQVPRDTWSAAGVTAIVDSEDQSIYQTNTTGSISIRSSVASGTLDIRFPVQTMPAHSAPAGACTEMRALLRDTGSGARVIVRLMQLGIKSGFDGQLTNLGQIDTNTTPRLTQLNEPTSYAQYRTCLNVNPDVPFDFSFFTYYVEAELIKSNSGGNPGLKAVQICHTEEQCEP
jgi:hypothetical protein